MHTITPAMQADLDGDGQFNTCIQIKRLDGMVLGLTTADRDLLIDIADGQGTVTYRRASLVDVSPAETSASGSINTGQISGYFDSPAITEFDIRAGKFDGATVVEFIVNRGNLPAGIVPVDTYQLGEVAITDSDFKVELDGVDGTLKRLIGEVISALCLAHFGDARCKYPLDPPAWLASTAYLLRSPFDADITLGATVRPTVDNGFWFIATVGGTSSATEPVWPLTIGATVADNEITWEAVYARKMTGTVATVPPDLRTVLATGTGAEADHFKRGKLIWLAGSANFGVRPVMVESDDGSGSITLSDEMRFPMLVGDTFEVIAGCQKRKQDCQRHKNIYNARAHYHVPPKDIQVDST